MDVQQSLEIVELLIVKTSLDKDRAGSACIRENVATVAESVRQDLTSLTKRRFQ